MSCHGVIDSRGDLSLSASFSGDVLSKCPNMFSVIVSVDQIEQFVAPKQFSTI